MRDAIGMMMIRELLVREGSCHELRRRDQLDEYLVLDCTWKCSVLSSKNYSGNTAAGCRELPHD
jgi:hypothetical protein